MTFLTRSFKTLLWGNSVALAWTWGIGLFFTVQMAIQFGFEAMLAYATVNAVGLAMFGVINHGLAQRFAKPSDYENYFFEVAKKYKFGFIFYQFIAITLTLFAVLKFVSLPLGILSALVCIMFIGAVIFVGEEYNIEKIKYSHAAFGLIVFGSLIALLNSQNLFPTQFLDYASSLGTKMIEPSYFELDRIGLFAIPVAVGFLFGPWMDLQHWQRTVQIHKEGLSVAQSYIVGGLLFWCIIVSNGMIALAAFKLEAFDTGLLAKLNANIPVDSLLFQFETTITQALNSSTDTYPQLAFYIAFVAFAAMATFDSGYVSLKWYVNNLIKDSQSIVLSVVPPNFISSPVPLFFLAIITATITMHMSEIGRFLTQFFDASFEQYFRFELRYYLAFYAAFFVIYAVTLIRSSHSKTAETLNFSALKQFATALFAISIFGIGYFIDNTVVMALGSITPVLYGLIITSKTTTVQTKALEEKSQPEIKAQAVIQAVPAAVAPSSSHAAYSLPEGAKQVSVPGCYLQDGWFVHSFLPTYQDTNSVGNIYFAMYAMWVGKTRELFFLEAIPVFDPQTSPYLILTKAFEHKFLREAKEFDKVTIHIKVAKYNRKFCTLEHKILNEQGEMLGKGQQQLMFVDSKDYGLIDIPEDVLTSFMPFITAK